MLDIRTKIPLAPYTTLKIGGAADYFVETQNEEEIIEALQLAEERKIPYYILSGGSNVLVSDQGFRGLIIRITNYELQITNTLVTAGSGVSLPLIAKKTAEQGLFGMEFGIGVPGTVGGAVYGNAGAFGQETKDVLQSVRVLMPEKNFEIVELPNNTCAFGYRESIFKHHKNWIILSAIFALKQDTRENCEKRMMEMLKDKTVHQPMGEKAAGSIFKNPPGFSAWRLIEDAGMRGCSVNGARVASQHANYLINTGSATADDFTKLIALIKKEVQKKCAVILEEEIQYVGF